MIGYIYCITDTTNGKKYIGQHHYDKEELDPNYHGSGRIIKKIYNKRPHYLKEEYLKTCHSQKELDEWEKYFIFSNNTLYPNGYNLTEGGEGCVACEETRRKISEAMKGKTLSEEHRRKLSEAKKGRPSCRLGKKHSEESKIKMSEVKKGKPSPNKGKPMSEEQKKKLSEVKKGKPAHNKGVPMSEEQKKKLSEAKKGKPNIKLSKKVLQFSLTGEFIKEWSSTQECGRNGFNFRIVSDCCLGKQKTHQGYIWKYKD